MYQKNRLNWIKSTFNSETSRTGHSDVFTHEVTAELIHICSGCMFCGCTFLFECPPSTSSSDVWTNASGPKSYSLSSEDSNIEEILDIIQDHCQIYNSPIWIKRWGQLWIDKPKLWIAQLSHFLVISSPSVEYSRSAGHAQVRQSRLVIMWSTSWSHRKRPQAGR